ncbi:MAG: hypothetical protein RLZZ304_714 [Actinomycetota bacterium]
MIRWIQKLPWLSGAYFAIAAFLIFGGVDLMLQGPIALGLSAIISLALLFANRFPLISVGIMAVGSIAEILLGLHPLAAGATAAFALALVAAFATPRVRWIALAVAIASGLAVVLQQALTLPFDDSVYGMGVFDEAGRITTALFGSMLVISINLLSWLVGRLGMTRDTHVGTNFDRAVAAEEQARLALEIAEQNERFQIARDINELIIQRVSAVISQGEGGTYAAKTDATAGARALDAMMAAARSAHAELRRLFDMLNKTHEISAAPPGIDELSQLVVAYREHGYTVTLRHEGTRFGVNDGAQLAIYRIVYEAMRNVRTHAPSGSDVTIDFSWVDHGVQVLVKDNGIEVANRSTTLDGLTDGYTAADDLKSLVEPISGASLTGMRERAALYGGRVEATRVPGVGFTVSAIFPNLRELAGV